ncbi:Metallo-dependent phosphatase-like protein [Absidia repens]|uniref:Metallo-dependent phosphatase-like protein n=1 Tax=Absidia repens TaxID=90262 RepID=A0A1X2IEW4_9FUNG|nr:Metallo-dependent phosphatase-like protein [Absidia repens]
MKLALICASCLTLFFPIIHSFPLAGESTSSTGFFMQVTDFHLDSHYMSGSDASAFCHRKESLGEAGKFGALNSKCDSPPILVEEAFKFMKQLPTMDFVLYTGDSARHNRDKKEIPRTYDEALETQTTIINHFMNTFDTSKTKVVPVVGNNDVPKNNDCSGDDPSYQQIEKVWEPLQLNLGPTFRQGGYYAQDLIPGKLRVLNTNTMLFSTKNKLTKEDCDESGSPGQLHIAWLKAHLDDARSQQTKVYISAHVPPNSKRDRVFYKPVCYNQYYGLLGDYSDVLLGHFAGHFNNDVLTAVVDGPGLDQFDGSVKGEDDDKGKIKKRNKDDKNVDDGDQGTDEGQPDHDDEDNEDFPTSGTGKAIVTRNTHIQKRGHKKDHSSFTTTQLQPPYGHIALLGKPISPLPSPLKVLGILFNSPSIVPLNNPGLRVYEYETKGDTAPIGTILNYKQYYADLQEANASGQLTFKLEYDAAELYRVERFDKEGMARILETMASQADHYSVFTRVMNSLPPLPEND